MFCLTMLIYKIRLDPKYFVMKRMKLKLIFLALVIIVLVTVCIHLWVTRIELTSLTLKNIESLAQGEGSSGAICYGIGSVDCPDGTKAAIVYSRVHTNLSLE